MEILEARTEDVAIVHVVGNVNSSNALQLDNHLQKLVGTGCRAIVIDLGRLEYMTSAGFRCLLRAEQKIGSAEGKLALYGLQGLTRELFEVGGFLEMFAIAASREEAMRLARGG